MASLLHLQVQPRDVQLLSIESEEPARNGKQYCDAYHEKSVPINFPIPASLPGYKADLPIRINKKVEGVKPGPPEDLDKKVLELQTGIRPTTVPIFHGTHAAAGSKKTARPQDVLFFAGGPVWGLDWLPSTPDADGSEAAIQYVAVNAHPKRERLQLVCKPTLGPGMLQIWAVHSRAPAGKEAAPLPKMRMGLCHDHGIIWDAKWCPQAEAQEPGSQPGWKRLGLLAVLFGDGMLHVLAVPNLSDVAALAAAQKLSTDGSAREHPDSSRVLFRLRPQASAPPVSKGCLGSCVEWLPSPPHDLLLVGHWDGSVAVLQIPGPETPTLSSSGPNELSLDRLCHIVADQAPLRTVAWLPQLAANHVRDTTARHIFVTAGHSATIKIWDSRDPFQCAFELPFLPVWITDIIWMNEPAGIVLCQDDGLLKACEVTSMRRQDSLQPRERNQYNYWGLTRGSLWSVHANSASGHLAYGAEGGQVVLALPGFFGKPKAAKTPHTVVSSSVMEDGILNMSGPEQPRQPVTAKPPMSEFKEAFDYDAAVYRVRWSCSCKGQEAAWLASGGQTGIVRCQRVKLNC